MNAEMTDSRSTPINVNTASVELLRDGVSGIGQAIAERIVAYRQEHGPFTALSELINVRGIGVSSLSKLASQLSVGEETTPAEVESALVEGPMSEVEMPPLEERPQVAPEGDDLPMMQPAPEGEDEEQSEPIENEEEPEVVVAFKELQPAAPVPPPKERTSDTMNQSRPRMAAAPMPQEPARGGLWHDLLLVVLGGLAGVVLTLVVAVIWSGTLDYAPRREVDALSRNLATMYSNYEADHQQIGVLTEQNDVLSRRVEELQALEGQVTRLATEVSSLQEGVKEAQSQLTEARSRLGALEGDLAALSSETRKALGNLDQRVTQAEDAVDTLNESLQVVTERVERFDSFFASLRDLLIDLQGLPETTSGGASQ
ncbi:MAG: hypothetical protein A2Y73_02490 [Chloroflexi bacterium RBG_13_56_8]|nr:MAG: hypothetical protein A2Y73_02490 [Chloroflexi bacterium RBG_13_56_8]